MQRKRCGKGLKFILRHLRRPKMKHLCFVHSPTNPFTSNLSSTTLHVSLFWSAMLRSLLINMLSHSALSTDLTVNMYSHFHTFTFTQFTLLLLYRNPLVKSYLEFLFVPFNSNPCFFTRILLGHHNNRP